MCASHWHRLQTLIVSCKLAIRGLRFCRADSEQTQNRGKHADTNQGRVIGQLSTIDVGNFAGSENHLSCMRCAATAFPDRCRTMRSAAQSASLQYLRPRKTTLSISNEFRDQGAPIKGAAPITAHRDGQRKKQGRLNFIRQIIDADNAGASTAARSSPAFPPEPDGYLHRHRSCHRCLNFGLGITPARSATCAKRPPIRSGRHRYKASIKGDGQVAGLLVRDKLFTASDYFDALYAFAQHFIERGLACVDNQSAEEMRVNRGTRLTARASIRRSAAGSAEACACSTEDEAAIPTARTFCA